MDEETIGLNMSHRTKVPNNMLVDVEKLGDVVRVGVEAERERIIKLLEDTLLSRIAKANGKPVSPTIGIQDAVALIKGENK